MYVVPVPSLGVGTMGHIKSQKFQSRINPNTGAWVIENGFSFGTGRWDLICNLKSLNYSVINFSIAAFNSRISNSIFSILFFCD